MLNPPNPKTTDQLRAIFGLGKGLGFDKAALEDLASEMTGGEVERLSLLTFDQANAMVKHLGGDTFPAPGHVARRTANHRKQKAGIKTLETSSHIKLILDLAAKRNMTETGLIKLCTRIIKKRSPQTTAEGNKIVEALKAMNKRDGIGATGTVRTASPSVARRRSA